MFRCLVLYYSLVEFNLDDQLHSFINRCDQKTRPEIFHKYSTLARFPVGAQDFKLPLLFKKILIASDPSVITIEKINHISELIEHVGELKLTRRNDIIDHHPFLMIVRDLLQDTYALRVSINRLRIYAAKYKGEKKVISQFKETLMVKLASATVPSDYKICLLELKRNERFLENLVRKLNPWIKRAKLERQKKVMVFKEKVFSNLSLYINVTHPDSQEEPYFFCSIRSEDVLQKYRVETLCGHFFSAQGLAAWVVDYENNTCPACRSNCLYDFHTLRPRQIVDLFTQDEEGDLLICQELESASI